MDTGLNSRLMENNKKLQGQDGNLNDILKLTENTNQNLVDGKENLYGQRQKIHMGIDKVTDYFSLFLSDTLFLFVNIYFHLFSPFSLFLKKRTRKSRASTGRWRRRPSKSRGESFWSNCCCFSVSSCSGWPMWSFLLSSWRSKQANLNF